MENSEAKYIEEKEKQKIAGKTTKKNMKNNKNERFKKKKKKKKKRNKNEKGKATILERRKNDDEWRKQKKMKD